MSSMPLFLSQRQKGRFISQNVLCYIICRTISPASWICFIFGTDVSTPSHISSLFSGDAFYVSSGMLNHFLKPMFLFLHISTARSGKVKSQLMSSGSHTEKMFFYILIEVLIAFLCSVFERSSIISFYFYRPVELSSKICSGVKLCTCYATE